jgi:hypothetical protein
MATASHPASREFASHVPTRSAFRAWAARAFVIDIPVKE